jgi:hypothetical protein
VKGELRKASPAELTLAARITKADRLRAIETARHDGPDGLAELLDATPMRKHKRKQ